MSEVFRANRALQSELGGVTYAEGALVPRAEVFRRGWHDAGFVDREDTAVAAQLAATDSAVAATTSRRVSDEMRLSHLIAPRLHPSPPTVTVGTADGATTLVGTTSNVAGNNAAIRYTGCKPVPSLVNFYYTGAQYVTSTLDGGGAYFMDWDIDCVEFEFRLTIITSGAMTYRIYVDGFPLTADDVPLTGSNGQTKRIKLTFTDRKPRHIRVFTNCGNVGLTIGPNDTVWQAHRPLYSKRCIFLSDSFGAANPTYSTEAFLYRAAEMLGWEPIRCSQSGTGYDADGSGGGRTDFLARVSTEVAPAAAGTSLPVVGVIYGGTNDSQAQIETAPALVFAALAAALPGVPWYVFGVQYPSGAADATRDAKTAALQTQAQAAPNVRLFTSPKTWFTGTGRVGATTGTGNSDLYTSSDALHPSSAGHKYIGARVAESISSAPPAA